MEGGRAQARSSWLWDHTVDRHMGVIGQAPGSDFRFQLEGTFRDSLSRQLEESVRIEIVHHHGQVVGDRWPGRTVLLNSKEEHYQSRVVLSLLEPLAACCRVEVG